MKQCIEDMAFALWSGNESVEDFVEDFFFQFPDVSKYWDEEGLSSALLARV